MKFKLGDLIDIKHGFAFKGDSITTEDNGIVLVTPGNFRIGGGFKEDKCKFFNAGYPEEYVLKPNDLIVTMTDLSKDIDTLGYSALVPQSNRVYLHNQRIGLVEIEDETVVDKHYLYWYMRTTHYQKTIASTSSGSTVHHTSPDRIKAIEIDLPSIETQKDTASILDALDNKIDLNNQISENLQQQAQAIFRREIKEATTEVPFTQYIKVLGGGTPKTGKLEYWDGGIPFFTPKDVGTPYVLETLKTITEIGLNNCNSQLYPTNTTFVTARGTVGKVSLAGVPMAMNQSCYALTSDTLHPFLVYYYTLEAIESLKHKASGAVFDAIVTKDFESETIRMIPKEKIEKLQKLLIVLMKKKLTICKEDMSLEKIRDTILPKLMNGEIDFSNNT